MISVELYHHPGVDLDSTGEIAGSSQSLSVSSSHGPPGAIVGLEKTTGHAARLDFYPLLSLNLHHAPPPEGFINKAFVCEILGEVKAGILTRILGGLCERFCVDYETRILTKSCAALTTPSDNLILTGF